MRKSLPAALHSFPVLLLGAAVSLLLTACDPGTSQNASVQIQITDAPSDFIQSADVWISRVYLKCGRNDEHEDADDHFEGERHGGADSLEVRRALADSLSAHRHDDEDDAGEGSDHCDNVDLFEIGRAHV